LIVATDMMKNVSIVFADSFLFFNFFFYELFFYL